jgi:histone H2A
LDLFFLEGNEWGVVIGAYFPLLMQEEKKKKTLTTLSKKMIPRGKKQTRSARAGLTFPVGRVGRYLRKGGYTKRISECAEVYLGAVLEYLSAEILQLAGNARKNHSGRIMPRHLQIAISQDDELDELFGGVSLAGIPNLHTPEALQETLA